MVTIINDYPEMEAFWKDVIAPACLVKTVAFTDKKRLTAMKWSELIWRECGDERYYGEKFSFYYKLSARAATIYNKIMKREDITSQIVDNFDEFLKRSTTWREGDIQNIDRTINEGQEPFLSLKDISQGSYEPFQNRADYVRGTKNIRENIKTNKGLAKGLNEEGKMVIAENWRLEDERAAAGKILTAMSGWEVDLYQELQELRKGLFYRLYFPEGILSKDPVSGKVKIKTWKEVEEETGIATEETSKPAVLRYDKNIPYPQNLKNREVFLQEELKITRDKDLVQKRIYGGKNLIEAWEKPMELKSREEFDKIKDEVVGFEEFIEEVGNYLSTVRKKRKSGKQVLPSQRFYLLLGDPGIGKTYISGMIADYLGKQKIKINCATAFDTDIIGREQTYRGADFGNIARKMIDGKDSAPVVIFDEIDKCRDEKVLDIISVLFDNSTNKHDFEDAYFQYTIPMDRVFFIATANNIKKLMEIADFVLSRCTRVIIKPLSYKNRIELAKREIRNNLKDLELDQYINSLTSSENLLKKCLVKERGIRQTLINAKKIADQVDALDTKYGGDQEVNAGKDNIGSKVNFTTYSWTGLIVSDGLDPNCPAKDGKSPHSEDHKCFEPDKVPGWEEKMGS